MYQRMCGRAALTLTLFLSIKVCVAQPGSPAKQNFSITVWGFNRINRDIIADIEPIQLAPKHGSHVQQKIIIGDSNKGILKTALKGPSFLKLMNAWPDSTVTYIAIPGVDMVVHLDAVGEDNNKDIGPKETDFYNNLLEKSQELLKTIPAKDPAKFIITWQDQLRAIQDSVKQAESSGMSAAYTTWISQSIRSLFQASLCRQFVNYVTITRVWPQNIRDYSGNVNSYTASQFNQPALFTRETDKEVAESYYLFSSLMEAYKKGLPPPDVESTYQTAISYANKLTAEGPRNIMLRYLITSITARTTDTSILKWMKNTMVFGEQNNHLKKMIEEKQVLLRKLGRDRPAPVFAAVDVAGNKFAYEHYKGKYLFIDIWATWCVPCRKEIPYLEKLKQQYAGQPVEFISVSTDKNVNAWKGFVGSYGSQDQFHSLPGVAASISEVYHATLIPAFVLIDPQGKIVNPACFRPSDPALAFLLDHLLKSNNVQSN